jgi:hypothetical protein
MGGMGIGSSCEHAGCGGGGNSSVVVERHGHHRGVGFGVTSVDHGEGSVRTVCQGGPGARCCRERC